MFLNAGSLTGKLYEFTFNPTVGGDCVEETGVRVDFLDCSMIRLASAMTFWRLVFLDILAKLFLKQISLNEPERNTLSLALSTQLTIYYLHILT